MNTNKLLGQHFLINNHILNQIVLSIKNNHGNFLEIGGGTGNLTEHLVGYNLPLTVMEKDPKLFNYLKNKYLSKNIDIILEDCLKFNCYEQYDVIVGNLPYNISKNIILKLIGHNKLFTMCFLVQKEVADQFLSNSFLGTLSYFKYSVSTVCKVGPNNFSPRPKVDSTVILFTPKPFNSVITNNWKHIKEHITKLFNHKNKKLKNKLPKYSDYRITQISQANIVTEVMESIDSRK